MEALPSAFSTATPMDEETVSPAPATNATSSTIESAFAIPFGLRVPSAFQRHFTRRPSILPGETSCTIANLEPADVITVRSFWQFLIKIIPTAYVLTDPFLPYHSIPLPALTVIITYMTLIEDAFSFLLRTELAVQRHSGTDIVFSSPVRHRFTRSAVQKLRLFLTSWESFLGSSTDVLHKALLAKLCQLHHLPSVRGYHYSELTSATAYAHSMYGALGGLVDADALMKPLDEDQHPVIARILSPEDAAELIKDLPAAALPFTPFSSLQAQFIRLLGDAGIKCSVQHGRPLCPRAQRAMDEEADAARALQQPTPSSQPQPSKRKRKSRPMPHARAQPSPATAPIQPASTSARAPPHAPRQPHASKHGARPKFNPQ